MGVVVIRPPALKKGSYTMQVSQKMDWLSFTRPAADALDLLWGPYPTEDKPRMGYTAASRNESGAIVMRNPDRPDMGVHYILSGAALTNMRATGLSDMDMLSAVGPGGITRLDLAVDVIGDNAPFDAMAVALQEGKCRTSARKFARIKTLSGDGDTIYIGARPKTLMRIYDKAAQTGSTEPWARIEVEFKHGKAESAARQLLAMGKVDYRPVMQGIASFPGIMWWEDVMGTELTEVKEIRRESDTWLWLIRSVAPSLAREVQADRDKLHLFVSHVIDLVNEGSE